MADVPGHQWLGRRYALSSTVAHDPRRSTTDTDGDGNLDRDRHADGDGNRNSNRNGDGNGDGNLDCDCDSYGVKDADCYRHADAESNRNVDTDADSHANRACDRDADTNAGARHGDFDAQRPDRDGYRNPDIHVGPHARQQHTEISDRDRDHNRITNQDIGRNVASTVDSDDHAATGSYPDHWPCSERTLGNPGYGHDCRNPQRRPTSNAWRARWRAQRRSGLR